MYMWAAYTHPKMCSDIPSCSEVFGQLGSGVNHVSYYSYCIGLMLMVKASISKVL